MDSDDAPRETRWDQTGSGRTERSPGGSVKRARERVQAGQPYATPPPLPLNIKKQSPPRNSPPKKTSPLASPQPDLNQTTSPPASAHTSTSSDHLPRGPPLRHGGPARNYWEEAAGQERLSEYSTTSRPSTIATGTSEGSIPDFPPVPPIPPIPSSSGHPQSRRGTLGPPPSSRRGVSSYYSQASFVPPIPEEMPDGHASFVSSGHGVQESWGDGPPGYYMGMGAGIDEEEEEQRHSGDSSGRQSKASDYGDQASLVKGPPKAKPLQPFMETIESGDESTSQSSTGRRGIRELDWQAKQDERFRSGTSSSDSPQTDGIGRHNFAVRGPGRHPYSGYESDATFLDSPISVSPKTPRAFKHHTGSPNVGYYANTPSSRGSPVDPRVHEILGNLEKGGAITSADPVSGGDDVDPRLMNEKAKRPPPLNLQNTQARGPGRASNTSLPEMIRRATRLASNLDRGKTASRVGMLDMINKKELDRHDELEKGSQTGSISDMLAAFPSPSATTSPGLNKPSNWGAMSPHGRSNLSRAQTVTYGSTRSREAQKERRCCGLPFWAFILMLIILLLVIAAAVVIPITLIVIPKQNKSSSLTMDSCQKTNPCANNGQSIVVANTCRCICTNQFTGSSCSVASDGNCATTTIAGQNTTVVYNSATVGSSIPRLLASAQANYSLPLIGWKLAAIFSNTNLTCTSENALVTFNSASERVRRRSLTELLHSEDQDDWVDLADTDVEGPLQLPILPPLPRRPSTAQSFFTWLHLSSPAEEFDALNLPTKTLSARASAQSSNGIVFAGGSGPAGLGSSSTAPTDAPLPANPSSTSTPSASSVAITASTVDFARTAVLLILQEIGTLAAATQAMNKLGSALAPGVGKNLTSTTVDAGGGVTVDFGAGTLAFGNGTTIGGHT